MSHNFQDIQRNLNVSSSIELLLQNAAAAIPSYSVCHFHQVNSVIPTEEPPPYLPVGTYAARKSDHPVLLSELLPSE